jgi:hypothetical protein
MHRLRIRVALPTCLFLLLSMFTSYAEISIELITQTGVGGQIVYPQIGGLYDERVSNEINRVIVEKGQISEHILTLSTITSSGGWGINVRSEYILHKGNIGNDILSVLLTAVGKMPNGRFGHVRTPMNFNLTTGEQLDSADIFFDTTETAAYLDQYVSEFIEPVLSSYMENNNLVPVPIDRFYLDESGIIFCYDQDEYSMLSGDSGAVELKYFELQDYLDLSANSIPAQIGMDQWFQISDETASLIASASESGMLYSIPFGIGSLLRDAITKYHLLSDPDYSPGGMYFELEEAKFRGLRIMSDIQTDDYSVLSISGIQTERFNLFGIITGSTTQDEWRRILGVPDISTTINQDTSIEYGIPQGQSDSYQFAVYELTLYANEESLLALIRLEERGL